MSLAYIDPGSGSLMVQAIVGVALGIGIFFKSVRLRIQSIFGAKKSRDAWEDEDDDEVPKNPPDKPAA